MNDLIMNRQPSQISSTINYSQFSESLQKAKQNADDSLRKSSQETYKRYLVSFYEYCQEKNVEPFELSGNDASLLCACFLTDMCERGIKTKSLIVIRAALKYEYEKRGYDPSPTSSASVKRMMKGIDNNNKYIKNQKEGLNSEDIVKMILSCDIETKKGVMHRAIIAMCFCGAFRRSEIASLKVENLTRRKEGYVVKLEDSKTGEIEKGVMSGEKIPLFEYLNEWFYVSGITEGYIFHPFGKGDRLLIRNKIPHISSREVCRILQLYADKAGIDKNVGGHSTRRGMAEEAAENGVDISKIADLLGHSNLNSTKIYVKTGNIFRNHAAQGIV